MLSKQAELHDSLPRRLMAKMNLSSLLLQLSKNEKETDPASLLEECSKLLREALQLQAI
jgi:signal transduction histidine kinase